MDFSNLKFKTKRTDEGLKITSASLFFKNSYGVYVYEKPKKSGEEQLYGMNILYEKEIDRFSYYAPNGVFKEITAGKISVIMKHLQKL